MPYYAVAIFNVIPVQKLVNKNGFPVTPYELFLEEKPRSQCSVKGIFIGLSSNQQGYLIYMPQSNRIAVSVYVYFDESFSSAIVLSWTPFQDAIRLHPN